MRQCAYVRWARCTSRRCRTDHRVHSTMAPLWIATSAHRK